MATIHIQPVTTLAPILAVVTREAIPVVPINLPGIPPQGGSSRSRPFNGQQLWNIAKRRRRFD
jgi:hypothetical protein